MCRKRKLINLLINRINKLIIKCQQGHESHKFGNHFETKRNIWKSFQYLRERVHTRTPWFERRAMYRALAFQSQVSLTSGKSCRSWYQSKLFVSRQTKYCIIRDVHIFFAPLFLGVAPYLLAIENDAVAFYADPTASTLSFPLWGGSVKREPVNPRGTLRKTRAAVFYLATANFIFASKRWSEGLRERRKGGRHASETIGNSWRRSGWLQPSTDIHRIFLPDNGRSESHWSGLALA